MRYFNEIKSRLNCSDFILKCLIGVSIFWLACCLALFIPSIRDLIIRFAEFIIRRPLNYPLWHERFITIGKSGIVLYVVFFFVFFFNDTLSRIMTGKKPVAFMIVFLFLSVFTIMFRTNWVFGDDHHFIVTTAINKYIPLTFNIGGGRFWPLGLIHYNLPLFIFRCLGISTGLPVEAHFVVISSFFIISIVCLYLLFNRIKPNKNNFSPAFGLFFVCTFFLLTRSFSTVFLKPIFAETPVIMSFSIFMLMYHKALETDKIGYYAAALLAAVYSSYCKEPVFGAFLVFAFVNHLFRYKRESKWERTFYKTLIANGVVFLILYYFLSFRNATGFYNEGRVTINDFRFFLSIIMGNPVLIIMFLFGFIRLYFIVIEKDREHLYYDSLLLAGVSYSFAIMMLHLNWPYYFLPSVTLFLPSLVYWVEYLYEKKYALALCLFFTLMPIYAYNLGPTTIEIKDIWRQRQEFMPFIADLFSEYSCGKEFIWYAWYESDNMITDYTFINVTPDWSMGNQNAFLNYLNKTQGKDFFLVKSSMDNIDWKQNILFFYPIDSTQNPPMPDELVKTLQDNNFELYREFYSYGVLVYRRQ